jgi:hypothetical protein
MLHSYSVEYYWDMIIREMASEKSNKAESDGMGVDIDENI